MIEIFVAILSAGLAFLGLQFYRDIQIRKHAVVLVPVEIEERDRVRRR